MSRQVGRVDPEREKSLGRERGTAAPEEVVAGPDMALGAAAAMSLDPRLTLRANGRPRADLLSGLQQRLGNAGVQRALAGGARASGTPARPARTARRPTAAPSAHLLADTLQMEPLADGTRFSFRLQALLDNGEPSGQPPEETAPAGEGPAGEGPAPAEDEEEEEEEEEEQPIEGTIGPLSVQAVEDRHTLGVLNLRESTVGGGVDLGGGMGRCEPQINANFKVTPIGSKENRNYWVVIDATVEYHWAVSAAGRENIASADDPRITMENWSQVYYDLMPIGGDFPRSPRRKYWCSDLSAAHELFHRDDFSKAFRRYKPEVEAWLPTQTAANIEAARGKCDEAMQKLIGKVEGYMGSGDFAPCEARAYKAGAPAYRALALAVRRRAKLYEWPDTPVERWEGEAGPPSAPGGAPGGTRDASPGGSRPSLQSGVQRLPGHSEGRAGVGRPTRPAAAVRVHGRLSGETVARGGPQTGPGTTSATPTTETAVPATPTTATPASPTQVATTRAGTPSTAWPEPGAEERRAILQHIRGGNGRAALTALWDALRPGLSLAGRITLEPTDRPGFVDGRQIGRGAGAIAMALAYVPQQAGCTGAPPDTHWQRHTANELQALMQVNLGSIRGMPEERLVQLYSTLMHEYTHVEQRVAQGLHQGLTFLTVGDREFLSDEQVPAQQRELLAALDEIEAYASEIERAGQTGLGETSNIRITVSELWGAYRSYFSRSGGQPDAAVATRVYQNIERGRELYRRYLQSPQATPLPPRLQQFALTLYDCPRDYDLRTSILLPFVRSGAQPTAPGAQPTAPASQPAAPGTAAGSTTAVQRLPLAGFEQATGAGMASRSVGPAMSVPVLPGSGQPLPERVRSLFEPDFGLDFSRVRVHTDEQAAESARAAQARAYTLQEHIVFGAGEYQPETAAGTRLIAHELAHVAQGALAGQVGLQKWGVDEADPVAIERTISEVSHVTACSVRGMARDELDRLRGLISCTLETAFTACGSENYRHLVERRDLIEGELERRDVELVHQQVIDQVRRFSTTWRTVLREELARQGATDVEDWALEAIGSFVGLPYMNAHELYGGPDEWRAAYQRSGVYPPAVVCDQLGELTQRLARGVREYGPPGLTGHYSFYQEHDPAFPSAPGSLTDPRCAPGATLFHTANATWDFREQATRLDSELYNSGIPLPGNRAEVMAVRRRAGDLSRLLRGRWGGPRGKASLLAELERLAGRPYWATFAAGLSGLRNQVEAAAEEGVAGLLQSFAGQVYEVGRQTLAAHFEPGRKLSHEFTLVARVDSGANARLLFLDTWGPQGSGTMQIRPSTLGAERGSLWGFFQPPRPRRIPIYTPYLGVTLRIRGRVQEHTFDDIWQQSPVPPPVVFRYALESLQLPGISAYLDFLAAGRRGESLVVGRLGMEGGQARFSRPQWMTERVEARRRGR